MVDGSSATVGARLREAREKRGMTLRDIAARTRISAMSLEALERSDMSRLPGGIFTRAFIRAYASEVGLDPEGTIQDFIAQFPREAPAGGSIHAASILDGQSVESERRAMATGLRLLLMSLPIAGAVIYLGMRGGAPNPSNAPPPQLVSGAVPGQANGSEPPPVEAPPSDAAAIALPAQAAGLTMQIAPRGTCWVSVTVDGEQSFSGLMNPGDQRQVSAQDEIVLMIGDAGVFAYTLNGQPGRPLGAPGEVVSTRITVGDYRDYVLR